MENKLTPEEIGWAFALYYKAETCTVENKVKLVLKQLPHISDNDIYVACYAYDNVPFCNTKPNEWKISRETDIIKITHKSKQHSYQFDQDNGNVTLFIDGRRSGLGKQAASVQFLMRQGYAIPIFFHPKHWANNMTPHELGLATPDFGPLLSILNFVYGKDEALINEWLFSKRLEKVQLHDYKEFNDMLRDLCLQHNLDVHEFL